MTVAFVLLAVGQSLTARQGLSPGVQVDSSDAG
jgi:hypothetical protein